MNQKAPPQQLAEPTDECAAWLDLQMAQQNVMTEIWENEMDSAWDEIADSKQHPNGEHRDMPKRAVEI